MSHYKRGSFVQQPHRMNVQNLIRVDQDSLTFKRQPSDKNTLFLAPLVSVPANGTRSNTNHFGMEFEQTVA